MGTDALKQRNCNHDWKQVWDDDYFMGYIYYYDKCKKCDKTKSDPGPLSLGTYK